VEKTNAPAVVLAARQQIVPSEASEDAPFDRVGIAGLLYTATGTAALLVPLSSMFTAATDGWQLAF
jgi:hypothetical protein